MLKFKFTENVTYQLELYGPDAQMVKDYAAANGMSLSAALRELHYNCELDMYNYADIVDSCLEDVDYCGEQEEVE